MLVGPLKMQSKMLNMLPTSRKALLGKWEEGNRSIAAQAQSEQAVIG